MNYLILSAFLLINSYFGQHWSPVCALLWLVLLMIGSHHKPWSFLQGFVWGLLVFGFHLSWMLATFVRMDTGLKGCAIWLIAVTWFALSCAVWLWLTRYSWFFSTLLFFIFLTRWSLLLCGVMEGYPLIDPLLGLAVIPESLWIVQWIGDVGAFGLIVGFSWFLAQTWINKKKHYVLLALGCLMPFLAGVFLYEKKEHTMQSVLTLHPWWYGCKSPMFAGYRMLHELNHAQTDARTILMPESTFCFDLDEYKDFVSLWSNSLPGKTIIFGGHRRVCPDGDLCMNTVFVLCDGKIKQKYDKQHFMPFVERIPAGFDCIGLGKILIHDKDSGRTGHKDDLVEIEGQIYQIFICSELFFQAKKIKGNPVLLLWNESWLSFDWVKALALLYVAYFSVKHDVAVVYVSTQGRTNIR